MNQCVFIHDIKLLIVTVHVNDIKIFKRLKDTIMNFKHEIVKIFIMMNKNELFYLKMHVK